MMLSMNLKLDINKREKTHRTYLFHGITTDAMQKVCEAKNSG